MPNYVNNIIEITSKNDDSEDIIKFLKQHYNEEGFFDFNTIIPEPTTEEECPFEYNFNNNASLKEHRSLEVIDGNDWFNWYDWRLKYWGTKWNAGQESKCYYYLDKIRENNSYWSPVYIHFSTAWSPPYPIFKKIYELHPELDIEITYHSTENDEYGTYYQGGFDGNVVCLNQYDLKSMDEKIIMRYDDDNNIVEYGDNDG